MNTEELIAQIGKDNALAVTEWLEFTIEEFREDRPEDESTAEFLENLTDHLRLHASSEFVRSHQGTPVTSELRDIDVMDL